MSDRSQYFYEVAKEITLAAIEKGIIIAQAKGNYESPEQISEFNQRRAKEIGDFYKTIAKAVNETVQGNFDTNS